MGPPLFTAGIYSLTRGPVIFRPLPRGPVLFKPHKGSSNIIHTSGPDPSEMTSFSPISFIIPFPLSSPSAGVGRTGTYMTIQSMIQMIEEEERLDIFNFVLGMRHERNLMVQTEVGHTH